jgi:4-amino-4-deoxy-L-arabinose transferase-like glycosyltransferase
MARRLKLRLYRPSAGLVRRLAQLAVILVIGALLTWRLRTLPAGLAEAELLTLDTAAKAPVWSPQFVAGLPYHLLLKGLRAYAESAAAARLLSIGLSALGLMAFYKLAREWWSRPVATISAVLLGTSYWSLVLSRLIGPHSLILLWTMLLLIFFLRLKHESKWWQIAAAGAIAGASVYVSPFTAWMAFFMTISSVWHSVSHARGRVLSGWAVYCLSGAIALIPISVVALRRPGVLLEVAGLGHVNGFGEALHSAARVVHVLIWDGSPVALALPAIGLIDIALIILLTLGVIRTVNTWRIQRSQLLIGMSGLAVLLAVAGGLQYPLYSFGLPVVFLCVGRGVNQYLSEWFRRFPRNPSGRLIGMLAIASLVILISVYNLRSYYVAWAKNPTVKAQFR